ncbi:GIY-YIG catalytic domain-containing endonuclease [Paramecium bursaria Chlorella virus NYs1]|uniref:GIY-YIG catalytic domain-containing endonuclease n=1 Tax=Paramecium bursaria Chlorella virus NYs1 TaxID=83442 RepID=M1I8R5_9PHYC|nr:GIY-YIG catalytic domain-containing endonuclease [Paramecium bursaria Chlorella virus NYs1]AGE58661.1 GIY-YIG catalytic domain-containing endonuclease [Paramecium bursaria Chlorella virus NYs1]
MSWVIYAISKNIPIIDLTEGAMLVVDPEEWNYLYIGYTNNFGQRMTQHIQRAHNERYMTSQKFYNRIRNKWNVFDKTILIHNISSEQEAKDLEIELVAKYNSYKNGLNSTPGGDGTGSGADNPVARVIRVYNNFTGEETSYEYIGKCVAELGISEYNISHVLSPERYTTQARSKNGIWYQFKYSEDMTPFIENMPTPGEKISGTDNYGARVIRVYNNSTGEETSYEYIRECVAELGISESSISQVLSPEKMNTQAKSRDGTWYQFKYAEDMTPFVENMLRPDEKQSGGLNSQAKPVCAFGKLYDCAVTASQCLNEVVDTNNIKFISKWIYKKKFPNDIFKVSKEFYESYKDSDIRITKQLYDDFDKLIKI